VATAFRRFDGEKCCERLRAAFADTQLKCLAVDAFWWSREARRPCPACACRPADVAAAWDTRQEWAVGAAAMSPGLCAGAAHARASRHYAHLLQEAHWACTSPDAGLPILAGADV
jgi:hypothetical protein